MKIVPRQECAIASLVFLPRSYTHVIWPFSFFSPPPPTPLNSVVGKMTEEAGKSSDVTAMNLDTTMQQLAEVAAEKTAYISVNRADFASSELAAISTLATEKMVESCLEITDADKLPADKVSALKAERRRGSLHSLSSLTLFRLSLSHPRCYTHT